MLLPFMIFSMLKVASAARLGVTESLGLVTAAQCPCCLSLFNLVAEAILCHFQLTAVPPYQDEVK